MEGPRPPDPPPCSDLQLVLAVCRDLVDPLNGCESIGVDGSCNDNSSLEGRLSCEDIFASRGGNSACCQQGGAQKSDVGSLSGWKSALVGT